MLSDLPLPDIHQSRRHHGPLALAQMPAVKVQADDEGGRIVALVDPVGRRHGGEPAGTVAVAAVENTALRIEPDGLPEAMAADIIHKAVEVGTGHHRESLGDGMVGMHGLVRARHQNGISGSSAAAASCMASWKPPTATSMSASTCSSVRAASRADLGHDDDLVDDAGKLVAGLGALDLGGEDPAIEVVELLVEDADEPDVLIARVLQVREPGDHLLAVQTVGAAHVGLAVAVRERLRLTLAPLEAEPPRDRDRVDEHGLVTIERGRITEALGHRLVMGPAVDLVVAERRVGPADEDREVAAFGPGTRPVISLNRGSSASVPTCCAAQRVMSWAMRCSTCRRRFRGSGNCVCTWGTGRECGGRFASSRRGRSI